MNSNDDVTPRKSPEANEVYELRAWQSPDMEILPASATASGRGANCEGSVFTNTS